MGGSNIRIKTLFAFSLLMATCCVCAAQYPTSTSFNVSSKFYNGKRLMLILGSPWMPNEHHDFKFVDTTQNVGNISRYFNVAKEKSTLQHCLIRPAQLPFYPSKALQFVLPLPYLSASIALVFITNEAT